LLHRKDLDLDETAVQSLEKRDGEKARRILEAYLFGDATYRDQRMLHLVEPGDDLAYEVLEHALADSRIGLRKAALQILGHVKTLRNARTRAITLAYTRRFAKGATDPEEWQELLYAWIAQVPDETIRLVREHWDAYEKRGWGSNALKTLQNLRAPDQDAGVVDFVLEKATSDGRHPDGEPLRLMYAATALDGRHGYRDDDLDTFWRALLHHPDGRVVMAAVRSLDHRGRGDLTDSLLPLLAKLDVADPSDVAEASDLVDVLARQPQANVEPALLGLVQDENADPVLRRDAGRALVGRVSEAGRRTLVDWLLAERTNPARAGVERAVARAVGSGGGASVAGRILDVLEARLRALFSEEGRLDPDAELEPQIGEQLGALARAVAFTGDATSLERLARLLFLPDLATFARRGVARQACRIGPADASAAARDGPTVLERWHRAGGPYAGLPAEIWHLVDGVKVVPDRDLATAFHAALGDGSAVLAFPDLYFDRIVALLHDRRTGDLHEAASVLEAFAWRAEPVGGAADFGMALDRMRRFAWARRFDEAVAEQERALGILSRRAYDDDSAWSWRNERGTLEALRGAAAAAAGRQEAARTYFANARAIHPYSSQVLRDAAWLRALTGLDLDAAMQDAERAVTLERRQSVRSAASVQTGDVLAFVHLTRGEAYEAADILQEVVHYAERHAHLGGRSHLHLAEALMLAGYPADAWKALRTALDLEPTLAEEVPGIDAFAPWKEKGLLDPLLADARERFFERIERD
jgi:tetratricopeptide (TPR) repeat protein